MHVIYVIATFRVEYGGMELMINGQSEQLPEGLNATGLIAHLGLQAQRLALEVNREIVPRSRFDSHYFNPGDCVEIVRAIGGGGR